MSITSAPHSSISLLAFLHAVGACTLCWSVIALLRIDSQTRPAALMVALGLCFLSWNGLQAALLFQTNAASILSITRFSFGLACIGIPLVYWLSCIILQCETQRLITIRIHLMVGVTWAMLSAGTPWVVVDVSERSWGLGANLGPLAQLQVLWLLWMISQNLRDHLAAWSRPQISADHRHRIVLNGTSCAAVHLMMMSYVFVHVPALSEAARIVSVPVALVAIPLFVATGVHIIRNYWLSEVNARAAAQDMADLYEGVVLVLDDAGTIRYANAQCLEILGMPPERLIGHQSQEALGQSFALEHLLNLSRASGRSAHHEIGNAVARCCVWRPMSPNGGASNKVCATRSRVCRSAGHSWLPSKPHSGRFTPRASRIWRCVSWASPACG
jgi:PAS domain-containing protein